MSHHVILYPIIFPLYPYCVLDWKCHYSLFSWILNKIEYSSVGYPHRSVENYYAHLYKHSSG
jgi:hypothetical protein